MRKRRILSFILWIAAMTGLFLVWVLSNSLLWLVSMLIVLCMPFVSALLLLTVRGKISYKMTLDPMAQKGNEAKGVLTMKNASLFSVRTATILHFHNELTGEEDEEVLYATVPSKEKAEIVFHVKSRYCGRIKVSTKNVTLPDMIGFLLVPVKTKSASAGTTMLPVMFPSEVDLTLSSAVSDENETYAQDRSGYDYTEMFKLREYVPGDNLHKIHWKLTAKTDEVIVREGSLPLQRSLLVFWDKSVPGKMQPAEADALAESISSVCQSLSESGYAYTLGWKNGEETVMEETDNADELLSALPRLVSGAEEGLNENRRDFMEEGEKVYGSILLFAHDLPENLDELCTKSRVILFLCNENDKPAPCRKIFFTPKDYAEKLQNLEFME